MAASIEQLEHELARENAALHRALRLLHELANLVRSADEPRAAAYAVLTSVTAGVGLGMNRAMMFAPAGDDPMALVGLAAVGPLDRAEADRVWRAIEAEKPDLETLFEAGLRQLEAPSELDRIVRDTRIDLRTSRSPIALAFERPVAGEGEDPLLDVATTIAAPMRTRDRRAGVLVADNAFTGEIPDPTTRLVFDLVADHAGRALEGAARFARVAREARLDALTGLDTRRVGLEVLEHALARGAGTGLVLIDLDDFKRMNDEHGHPAGDAVLAAVGERLRGLVTRGRRAFRYGGEELAMIVEGEGAEGTLDIARSVHDAVRTTRVRSRLGRDLAITCSVGVAWARDGDVASLVRSADDALLRAKRAGKDRVERG